MLRKVSAARSTQPYIRSRNSNRSLRAGIIFWPPCSRAERHFCWETRMSLEKWVEYGWLRREPTSPREIKDLLGIVERSLADSKVEAVSTDLRFIAAFHAAFCVATIALRASGLRTVTQA